MWYLLLITYILLSAVGSMTTGYQIFVLIYFLFKIPNLYINKPQYIPIKSNNRFRLMKKISPGIWDWDMFVDFLLFRKTRTDITYVVQQKPYPLFGKNNWIHFTIDSVEYYDFKKGMKDFENSIRCQEYINSVSNHIEDFGETQIFNWDGQNITQHNKVYLDNQHYRILSEREFEIKEALLEIDEYLKEDAPYKVLN